MPQDYKDEVVVQERPFADDDDDDNDDDGFRPVLPPRPAQTSPLLSPPPPLARFASGDRKNGGNEHSIQRKPLPKSPSPQTGSYDPIAMDSIGKSNDPFDDNNEMGQDLGKDYKSAEKQFGSPKAFHKTHMFFGYNLGYWRMPVRHGSIFVPLFLFTFLSCWYAGTKGFDTIQDVSGPFTVDCGGGQSGWTLIGLNIRFGKLSFGAAKAIDLAWNWVVGRGIQGLLSLLAMRVFQDALLRVVETTPVSHDLYITLALGPSRIEILWQLCIGMVRYGKWRAKFIFVWMFISTVFLLAFPSLMDLCSGYDTLYDSNFRWPNGTIQSTEHLANNRWMTNTGVQEMNSICCMWNIQSRTAQSDIVRTNETCYNSRFGGRELGSAHYNCTNTYNNTARHNTTTLYYWTDETLNTSWWNEFETNPENAIYSSYWSEWKFYPMVRENFPCVSSIGMYQFGFSFEWLFISTILTTFWLYGLWVLWLDCDVNSEFCRKGRRLGLWRAIADISEAMREDLGPNVCAYTEQELTDALRKRPPVKYYATQGVEDEPGHVGLSSRPSEKLRLRWNCEYGRSKY